MPDFSIEKEFDHPVIGLDEVGRGPIAGPVISCGCYFTNYSIQKEFNNILLEDGYTSFFNFPNFKEFVKSLTAESN